MVPPQNATEILVLPAHPHSGSRTDPMLRRDSPLSSGSLIATSDSEPSLNTTRTSKAQSHQNASPPANISNVNGNRKNSHSNNTSLRFFVVDHPTKLKDRNQMRENRKHERRKPMSNDIRVAGTGSAKKRKRVQGGLTGSRESFTTATSESHVYIQDIGGERRAREGIQTLGTPESQYGELHSKAMRHKVAARQIRFADDEAPLVHGISGGFNNCRYLRATPESIPPLPSDPRSALGSNLQPFSSCWPALQDPSLNVEELKWSCSRKFGSRGIAKDWVPTLLKSRHAFLSTICISASHDDIMLRALQTPQERAPFGSEQRMKIRSEVLQLINQALADPQMQTADSTLVAVLHVLNSEIMGCDDSIMRIHQEGLHNLVRQRGGLDRLGVDGQLASILTITMYIISALRETEPHADFIKYGSRKRTKPANNQNQLPESPVYCRPAGFLAIKRSISQSSPTYNLLESLRHLTHAFVRGTASNFVTPLTPVHVRAVWDQDPNTIVSLKHKIFGFPCCESIADSFDCMSDKYTYESLRRVALVYALALADEIPFSKAASQLAMIDHTNVSSLPVYPVGENAASTQRDGMSWHLLIKSALIRTNMSDCWGHMAGVLFWMALIAAACANPDSPSNKPRRELSPEQEEGRKWLAAIVVRCSIVLSFEYGGAILETLKRMVGIEQALAKAEAERGAPEEWFAREDVVYGPTMNAHSGTEGGLFGPAPQPYASSTFADFAQEFMSDLA
ncbi:hypothetical protein AC578_5445 [Pseudocercospora eumusae]|uniref:Transcription factor domain-containing protein n=1 Tax=Pseudocercospora eumusae TaxID=321146 RepID=A0A139HK23_9PEZI|nr:hypothetical protein AC578_5445 [Pseudocercospora eumusae]